MREMIKAAAVSDWNSNVTEYY